LSTVNQNLIANTQLQSRPELSLLVLTFDMRVKNDNSGTDWPTPSFVISTQVTEQV